MTKHHKKRHPASAPPSSVATPTHLEDTGSSTMTAAAPRSVPVSSAPPPVSKAPAPASAPPAPSHPAPAATSQALDLKYLAFVRASAIKFYFFLLHLYDYLKDKAGPLLPGIESVEGTVTSVVAPVLSRIGSSPDEYLKYFDGKIDNAVLFLNDKTPDEWKAYGKSAYAFALTIPEKSKAAIDQYNEKGAAATLQSYYEYYLPYILAYLQAIWSFLLTLPLFPQAVSISQPYLVFAAQQFNHLLAEAKKGDLPVFNTAFHSILGYVPAIPVEKLKKTE